MGNTIPVLISAPPVLVLLLILLVPSVLATPRIRSASEIEAAASEQEAIIAAKARIKEANIKAGAHLRDVRLKGYVGTVASLTNREDEPVVEREPLPDPILPPEPAESVVDTGPQTAARITRAMWQAMKLPERVTRSGVITAQEVREVLGISLSHARNLIKEANAETQTVMGRSGIAYPVLIESLYSRRTRDAYDWARRLETTLGIRKRAKLQVVPLDGVVEETITTELVGASD